MSQHTESPDIDLTIIRLPLYQLWRHVKWCTKADRLFLFLLESFSKPEINQFADDRRPLFINFLHIYHNVVKLQITMNHILLVQKVKSQQDLIDDFCSVRL